MSLPLTTHSRATHSRAVTLAAGVGVVGGVYAWAIFATSFTHDGLIGPRYNAPGADWMVFHAAIRAYFENQLFLTDDAHRFTAHLNATFGWWLSSPLPFHPWLYPPTFLLLLLPFGLLSFLLSYAAFQLASFAALAAASWRLHDKQNGWAFLALALSPAAAINVLSGQNAFLTTALLLGGFRALERRPVLGGVLLGLLTYKPQFWLLVPVALCAARQWSSLAAALCTAIAVALLSAVVFGLHPWTVWIGNFLDPSPDFLRDWLEFSRMWGVSVYACAAVAGAPRWLANLAQLAAIAIAAGCVWQCFRQTMGFRRTMAHELRIAVLLAATVLAAPHVSTYDFLLLAAAVVLVGIAGLRTGFRAGEPTLLLLVWLAPLMNPPRAFPAGRLTPVLILGLIGVVMARARRTQPENRS